MNGNICTKLGDIDTVTQQKKELDDAIKIQNEFTIDKPKQ